MDQLLEGWLDQPRVMRVITAGGEEVADELCGALGVEGAHGPAVGTDEAHQVDGVALSPTRESGGIGGEWVG